MLEYKRMNSRSAARVQELERRKTALQAGLQGIEVCWTEVRRFLCLFLARFRSCTRKGRTDLFFDMMHRRLFSAAAGDGQGHRWSVFCAFCCISAFKSCVSFIGRPYPLSSLESPLTLPFLFPPARSLTGGCVCCPRTHKGGGSAESKHEGAPAQVCRAL